MAVTYNESGYTYNQANITYNGDTRISLDPLSVTSILRSPSVIGDANVSLTQLTTTVVLRSPTVIAIRNVTISLNPFSLTTSINGVSVTTEQFYNISIKPTMVVSDAKASAYVNDPKPNSSNTTDNNPHMV